MIKVTKQVELEISPTPEEFADEFWCNDAKWQAQFLGELAGIFDADRPAFYSQLSHVHDEGISDNVRQLVHVYLNPKES